MKNLGGRIVTAEKEIQEELNVGLYRGGPITTNARLAGGETKESTEIDIQDIQ